MQITMSPTTARRLQRRLWLLAHASERHRTRQYWATSKPAKARIVTTGWTAEQRRKLAQRCLTTICNAIDRSRSMKQN